MSQDHYAQLSQALLSMRYYVHVQNNHSVMLKMLVCLNVSIHPTKCQCTNVSTHLTYPTVCINLPIHLYCNNQSGCT